MVNEPKVSQNEQATVTSESTEETSQAESPTLTESQAKAMAAKAAEQTRKETLADLGRLQKAVEVSNKVAQKALKRLQDKEEADLRREEAEAKDDPERLSAVQARRKLIEERNKADEDEQRREETATVAQTQQKNDQELLQYRAEKLASQYNVDADILVKYGGTTQETMLELAKSFGDRPAPGETKVRMTKQPDSGKTSGSTAVLTKEEVAGMSLEEQTRRQKELAAIPFGGLK